MTVDAIIKVSFASDRSGATARVKEALLGKAQGSAGFFFDRTAHGVYLARDTDPKAIGAALERLGTIVREHPEAVAFLCVTVCSSEPKTSPKERRHAELVRGLRKTP